MNGLCDCGKLLTARDVTRGYCSACGNWIEAPDWFDEQKPPKRST
jgi:hypothetical protein